MVDTCEVSYGRTNCYFSNPKNPGEEIETNDFVCTKMNSRAEFWKDMFHILE